MQPTMIEMMVQERLKDIERNQQKNRLLNKSKLSRKPLRETLLDYLK